MRAPAAVTSRAEGSRRADLGVVDVAVDGRDRRPERAQVPEHLGRGEVPA